MTLFHSCSGLQKGMESSWCGLLGIWQRIDIGLGHESRLKRNAAEGYVLCILMGLVKTLKIVIMGLLFIP